MGVADISGFDGFIEQLVNSTFPTSQEVDMLESIFRSGKIARILDIGCGYGRHAFELANRGYIVDAFDILKNRIETAAMRSQGNPRFRVGDMRDIPFDGPYDAAIAMYSTISSLSR